jgi:hypothetical protein
MLVVYVTAIAPRRAAGTAAGYGMDERDFRLRQQCGYGIAQFTRAFNNLKAGE